MHKEATISIKRRLLIYSPAIFSAVFLIAMGIYLDRLNTYSQEQELRNRAFNQLSVIRANMEGNINSNALSVRGLEAGISTEPDMSLERFSSLAKRIFRGHTQLRNIAAAPDLFIRYMYPLQGNEAAIGLDYRKNQLQLAAVEKAIDKNQLILAGPVNLIQGGQGFIARIPVFIESEESEQDKLWGIISAVIDSEKLYRDSGLRDAETKFEIAIRGKDALGEHGEIFYGSKAVFNSNPILINIALPYGSWQLAAIPIHGWEKNLDSKGSFRLYVVIISLLILLPLIVLSRFYEKKRESETLLRELFELSPVGIALNDYATGSFISVNSALISPAGYTAEEFMNLSYWDLTPREYEQDEQKQIESMERTNRYGPYEKEFIRKDGSHYPVLLNGVVVYDTVGKKYIWSIVEDISERKNNEKMKNEFVSTVSHELRTPLTSIYGAISLISGGAFGDVPEKMKKSLNIAKNNTERLTSLINDLLDLDKLSTKKMKYAIQPHELISLVHDSITNNKAYAKQYKIDLRFSSDVNEVKVEVDSDRLQQVLANIISNAIKFSHENSHVDISVNKTQQVAIVEIRDYGIGIPDEFHDQIFQKFSQADSSDTRKASGTGLGLSISREIIEQMNGVIRYESIETKGSSFYIELPLKS